MRRVVKLPFLSGTFDALSYLWRQLVIWLERKHEVHRHVMQRTGYVRIIPIIILCYCTSVGVQRY